MNHDKDYYAILGVLPHAEDIVIRAAYRALAQRYHPDRAVAPAANKHARMAELNEAYAVLSDSEKRKAYDRLRDAGTHACGGRFGDAEDGPPLAPDPLEKDWKIAQKIYPDLAAYETRLAQFSTRLAGTYRAYLLETRQFEPRESLAGQMEDHFLNTYFGEHERNVDFARRLILARQGKAARALNDTIRVLGRDAEPTRVIAQIAREFDVRHLAVNKERVCAMLLLAKASTAPTDLLAQLLSEMGGVFAVDAGAPGRATADRACKVVFEGKDLKFPTEQEFRSWFSRAVLPIAEKMAA